jgi:hypothetical protein
MLYITFGENVVLYSPIGVAAQPRSGVFNHFVVKLMEVYSPEDDWFVNHLVVGLMKIYSTKDG